MKIFSRQTLNTFIVGLCVGITVILTYMLLSGNLPWLKAAGVGTGAPDVNARYLDGYGTSLSSSSAKIYISDASGYLPDGIVDSGAIVDGTIVDADLAGVAVPTGMISMFDTSCPSGWTRVTGLDGKFLVGGSSYSASAGGSDSVTLSIAQLPAHTHTGTTAGGGSHTNNVTIYTDTVVGGDPGYWSTGFTYNDLCTDTITISSQAIGNHTHSFTTNSTGGGSPVDNRPAYATIVICKKD